MATPDSLFNQLLTGGIGAGVGGLFNIGSSLLGNAANKTAQREQNEFNAEQAQLNRDFQAQQAQIARDWQEEQYNKYSSPSAMVNQYKDAGLNPALMYGANLQSGTGSSPSPSGSAASGSPTARSFANISGIISDFLGLAKLKQEIDESQSRENANNAAAEKSYSGIRVDNASIKQMSVQNEQMLNSITNDNKRVVNETRHINAILTQISASNKVSLKQVEQIDAAIKRMSVQNALDEQQKNTLCAQQVLLEFQAEESGFRQHEILSKTRLNNAQANAMSESMYEQRFKNKYLYLYGSYPPAEAAIESATKWRSKMQSNFKAY